MFVWKALLNLTGLTVGALVVLTVWFTITAEPAKYNIDTRAGLGAMWLDADLEACARVEAKNNKGYGLWAPTHFFRKNCEYLRDSNVDHIEKLAHVLVGR